MTGKLITAVLLASALSPLVHAQELQVGSNAYVDMYFNDWHASKAWPGQHPNRSCSVLDHRCR